MAANYEKGSISHHNSEYLANGTSHLPTKSVTRTYGHYESNQNKHSYGGSKRSYGDDISELSSIQNGSIRRTPSVRSNRSQQSDRPKLTSTPEPASEAIVMEERHNPDG